jgi:aspartyl-tRNA(Asn)/glutamyl-tRNA(Gln) amidotransferase subunit A
VVGLKPTYGLVPLRGVVPLATSFDHVGPLARSAADCARILSVIAGADDHDPTTAPVQTVGRLETVESIAGLRLGVVRQLWDGVESAIADRLDQALEALRHIGVDLVDVSLAGWDNVVAASEILVACEAATEYGSIVEDAALLPEVSRRLRAGLATPAPDYVRARRTVVQFRHEYRLALRDVHLVAFPGNARTAPRIDPSGRRLDPSTTLRFAVPLNAIGAPALAVPAGFVEGLPISLQLAGDHGADGLLLAVAHTYQQITSWHKARPTIGTATAHPQ